MAGSTVKAGLIARVTSPLERFINRQILGVEPDPDEWPAPADLGRLPVPVGVNLSDEAGETLVLGREFAEGWPRRRTVIGAHAYRFEQNQEYDCGWRLCDVAARFVRQYGTDPFDCATIVPPPDTFGQICVLPWVAERLARLLETAYAPGIFETAGPLAVHPDSMRRSVIPLAEMFRIDTTYADRLKDARVLLIDWRRHSGRTLLALTRMLRRKGAQVVRFVWLG